MTCINQLHRYSWQSQFNSTSKSHYVFASNAQDPSANFALQNYFVIIILSNFSICTNLQLCAIRMICFFNNHHDSNLCTSNIKQSIQALLHLHSRSFRPIYMPEKCELYLFHTQINVIYLINSELCLDRAHFARDAFHYLRLLR